MSHAAIPTDTIKHLGAEFHRAADSLADTLARLDNARLERLAFLRRRSKDSTARLAAIKEELRTLPKQIAKWDAEAARLESQTAEPSAAFVRRNCIPLIEQPATPPAPTLLDLTKLPPGTVCEAVAAVFSENLSRQMSAGTRFVIEEHASDGDVLVESLDARQMWVRRLQPARVVKERGER